MACDDALEAQSGASMSSSGVCRGAASSEPTCEFDDVGGHERATDLELDLGVGRERDLTRVPFVAQSAVTRPGAGPTWVELSGCPQMSKKFPSV